MSLFLGPRDDVLETVEAARRLLSEFLEKKAPNFTPPRIHARAVVHGHCHHKAIMKMDAEEKLLNRLGLDFELLDSGCCGMAGAFGFEDTHYEVSMKCGERVLLPKVREAPKSGLIIADGFSCREQIKSGTDRRALHIAQVMQMGLRRRVTVRQLSRTKIHS